ncbi:MAG: DUF711 family protein [Isosphaeraceae bacterium]
MINHKTTAVRIIPVPGKGAGDRAVFGGLFWRDCHPSRPRRGRLDAFRPSRRPHPHTAFQPSKLKKTKKPLEEMRKVVTLFAIQTHRTRLHGQHPKHQRRMES